MQEPMIVPDQSKSDLLFRSNLYAWDMVARVEDAILISYNRREIDEL